MELTVLELSLDRAMYAQPKLNELYIKYNFNIF